MQVVLEIKDQELASILQTSTEEELRVAIQGISAIEPPTVELLTMLDAGLVQVYQGETLGPIETTEELRRYLDSLKK